jgi:hypothetical protein
MHRPSEEIAMTIPRFLPTLAARTALVALLAVLGSGCAVLNFVEDRLPPPEPTENGIRFYYKAPAARQVNVAGEFNNWLGTADGRLDPNLDAMRDPDDDGIWEITLPLPPGRYQYKYLVDQVDWQEDPGNPEVVDDGFGGKNSILVVPSDVDYEYDEAYVSYSLGTSARLKVEREHTFELEGHEDAGAVYVTGSFSDWDPQAVPMVQGNDGVWRATTKLPAGKHLYKFVVDGNWITDPDAERTVDDGYGGENAVIEIEG